MMQETIRTARAPRWLVIGSGVLLCMAMAPLSQAAEVCFTTFGGATHVQLKGTANRLKAAGAKNVSGRIFGSTLAPCAGLNQWPVVGTAVTAGNQVILAFRAMTVDAAACGAVDEIVTLDATTLSGPLQLHNDRNDFSNTTTMVSAPCSNPLTEGEPTSLAGEDSNGNVAP